MNFSKLNLINFRNYSEEEFHFSPKKNLITGQNGQGKTNLLEAVHYVALGFSQRTRFDKELIQWGQSDFILRTAGYRMNDVEESTQSVQVQENGEKRVKIDSFESKKVSDLLGRFSVVVFSPEDMLIITGGPSDRRRFLDALLCQHSLDYLYDLQKYSRVLKQRNALLKNFQKYSSQLNGVLDEQLVDIGSRVIQKRMLFIQDFNLFFKNFYENISGDGITLDVQYDCFIKDLSIKVEEIKALFAKKIREKASLEREIRTTLIGPHRDNLLFFLSEKSAKQFGSQGQKRLVAISLKMASAAILEKKYQEPPILLLDDVFSELDKAKREKLSKSIGENTQIFIASHKENEILPGIDKVIKINKGKLYKE